MSAEIDETLVPGTVFCTRSEGKAGKLIRAGAALLDEPNLHNHVALFHHWTEAVPWGLEGRPGGVGWVDMRKYVADKHTVDNRVQPDLTLTDGAQIAADMEEALLGKRYDWVAIGDATREALHMKDLWEETWSGEGTELTAGQMVCSSAAAYFYAQQGLMHPNDGDERHCHPSDWTQWIMTEAWA